MQMLDKGIKLKKKKKKNTKEEFREFVLTIKAQQNFD